MRGDGSIPTAFVPLIANRQALLLATQPRGVGAALPAGRGLWSPASFASRPLELQKALWHLQGNRGVCWVLLDVPSDESCEMQTFA